jgi:hypothetical protein
MAIPGCLHLRVLFYVGMICVIERAGAVLAAGIMVVRFLGIVLEIVQVRKGRSKEVIGTASEGARRVHVGRDVAEGREGDILG